MNYKFRLSAFYSQNFLCNPELVKKLIRQTSVSSKDLVLEIGPGEGAITSELAKVAGYLIGIELDFKLFSELSKKFQRFNNIELIHSNILNFRLPLCPYKVFSNIPFNISADIFHKLTTDIYFKEGYLIVQKEFAQKIIGLPYDRKNQMMSVLLKPWFQISIFYEFKRQDFYPIPGVDITMIRIIRLDQSFVDNKDKLLYQNFITYIYNKEKISRYSYEEILRLFKDFLRNSSLKEKESIIKQANIIQNKQKLIYKVHRTRNDKNWRKY